MLYKKTVIALVVIVSPTRRAPDLVPGGAARAGARARLEQRLDPRRNHHRQHHHARRPGDGGAAPECEQGVDRKGTRVNRSHVKIVYGRFRLKKKTGGGGGGGVGCV